MPRRILLFAATTGYQLRSFDAAARQLGVELTFATDRCHSLDDPWQDAAIPIRFHQPEAAIDRILKSAVDRPFQAVVSVGDRPTLLAARAAQALGLPGNPPEAVAVSRSKLRTRQAFASQGLPTPWFELLPDDMSLETFADTCRYPCIVKPTGLSGSRGVIRADSPSELIAAIARVRTLLLRKDLRVLRDRDGAQIIVEGFIAGHEYAVEGVLSNGRLQVLAIFDKPDPLDGPFFEETLYVSPPSASVDQEAIAAAVQRAVSALGLTHGAVHAECRVNAGSVVMLEAAARPIGGLCSRVLRFEDRAGAGPISLEELLLRHALGEDVSHFRRERAASAVMMIPIPARGLLRQVTGEDDARAVPGVDDVVITAKIDQLLEPLPEAGSYLGFIFAHAATAPEAEAAVREAHGRLRFGVHAAIDVLPA